MAREYLPDFALEELAVMEVRVVSSRGAHLPAADEAAVRDGTALPSSCRPALAPRLGLDDPKVGATTAFNISGDSTRTKRYGASSGARAFRNL
jgi:hypothetical protein